MIFLGATFLGDINSLMPPATNIKPIVSVQIFDGTYNHLFLSSDTSLTVENFDDEWTYDTKMNASFDDSLDAGNSAFSLKNTDEIAIKRRELGETKWMTIYQRKITSVEDFHVHYIDKYARAKTDYEYCVSSIVNNFENSYLIENVYSDFNGFYITDKDCIYGTIYDIDGCDANRPITNRVLNLLNSKYVSVVSNSISNYETGSVSGTFIRIDPDTGKYKMQESLKYRNEVKNRLLNQKPLILKIEDGRIWMIRVTGTVTDTQRGHREIRGLGFEWNEIGDANDFETLLKNNFIIDEVAEYYTSGGMS